MEDFEPLSPDKNSKLFCQERLNAITKKLESDGIKESCRKLFRAQFHEELTFPHQEILSFEEIVDRYGDVLTEQELIELKKLIDNGKKR